MHMDQLRVTEVSVNSIFLDPNNPRFWSESKWAVVQDASVAESTVQVRTKQEIDKHGVEDLYNSMLRNGFLLLDRIVVRPSSDVGNKFIVVEGNRRFRSLTKLRSDIQEGTIFADDVSQDYLDDFLKKTSSIEVLVYEGQGGQDISWMLQGIRHIGGIRQWEPAQKAKLVVDQIDKEGKNFTTAGQHFGLSGVAVGRLYRTFRALAQMRKDDEYGVKARNDYFSLFEAAYRNHTIRAWLDWSETDGEFKNSNNLKRFYAWIAPDDEWNKRRVHDPKHIKDLAYLIENRHLTLLSQFDDFELTLSEARFQATASDPKTKDWRKSIATALSLLGSLPQSVMSDDPEEFLEALNSLSDVIADRRSMLEVVLERQRASDEEDV